MFVISSWARMMIIESVCYDKSCLGQTIDNETYKLATAPKDTNNVGNEDDNAVDGDGDANDDDDEDGSLNKTKEMGDG